MTLTLTQSPRPSTTEHELLAATRAGDDRAFEELYSRYQQRISTFVLSKVGDHGRAEDIAQDVFISALRRLRSSDQRIAFKPWIYEIAKNACIDEFRRGARSHEVPLEEDGQVLIDRQPALSVSNTPVVAMESRQRLDDLCGAFGGLSPSHHRLLVMRELEGMSYDEIGDRLDMTRQMVESGLFRARRKLTEEYEELASGQRCEQVQTAIEAGTMRSVASLGLRQRRTFARHLAHCQSCRHVALMAGVDESLLKPRSIAAKIAALLPFPLSRWPRFGGRGDKPGGGRGAGGASAKGGPPSGSGRLAAWALRSRHVASSGPLQSAAGLAEPATSSLTFGPAAAAVAILALAGAGGGVATGLAEGGHARGPVTGSVTVTRAAGRGHLRPPRSGGAAGGGSAASGSAGAGGAHASLAGTGGAGGARSSASGARSKASGTTSGTSGGRPGAAATSSTSSSTTHNGTVARSAGAPGAAGGVVKRAGSTVTRTVSQTGQRLAQGLGKTVSTVGSNAGHTVSGLGNVVSGVGRTVSNIGTVLPSGAGKTVSGLGNTVSTVGNAVSNVGKTVSGVTTSSPGSTVKSTVSGVTSAAQGATSSATSAATGAVSGATSAASSVTQSLGSVTKPLGSATQSAKSAAQRLAGAAQSATSATQPVKSTTQSLGSVVSQPTSGLLAK
jgi:RNA polymerase sigma factor (sigma-70 family)